MCAVSRPVHVILVMTIPFIASFVTHLETLAKGCYILLALMPIVWMTGKAKYCLIFKNKKIRNGKIKVCILSTIE